MKRQMTVEERAKSDARREKFRELVKKVADLSDEERAQLAATMPAIVTCEGRVLSERNICLVAMQCPAATIVGGFRQWLEQGRHVRKGEKGLMIWIPRSKGDGDAPRPADMEPSKVGFFMGTIFDISQTDANEPAEVEAAA